MLKSYRFFSKFFFQHLFLGFLFSCFLKSCTEHIKNVVITDTGTFEFIIIMSKKSSSGLCCIVSIETVLLVNMLVVEQLSTVA